ncbi:hypothetical protein CKO28_03005 [Rhodovibrio sodomensis]|uniref:Cell wall hydrolase SleB domain-containing protein n=1 Tax=Rhodovibrio sodomensis TaxID=1088 RepID=A0ABS1DAR9_9PROT|nr:cell wall hydrolase [Rhodovibrio sodomensis]MBK1667012.1 hypothetical protein [Rhodovibrio sodomensis]
MLSIPQWILAACVACLTCLFSIPLLAEGRDPVCAIDDFDCRAFTDQLPGFMTPIDPTPGGPTAPYQIGDTVLQLDPFGLERQRRCLAAAVFGEARGEVEAGMEAVVWVIKNRISDPDYPATPCAVIGQRAQFEFLTQDPRFSGLRKAIESGSLPPRVVPRNRIEASSLFIARALAFQAMAGNLSKDPTAGATHFLAPEIMNQRGGLPDWAQIYPTTMEIGAHRFYRRP